MTIVTTPDPTYIRRAIIARLPLVLFLDQVQYYRLVENRATALSNARDQLWHVADGRDIWPPANIEKGVINPNITMPEGLVRAKLWGPTVTVGEHTHLMVYTYPAAPADAKLSLIEPGKSQVSIATRGEYNDYTEDTAQGSMHRSFLLLSRHIDTYPLTHAVWNGELVRATYVAQSNTVFVSRLNP